MVRSVADLADVLCLFLIFLFCFGSAGITQYSGRFRTRCVHNDYFIVQEMKLNISQGLPLTSTFPFDFQEEIVTETQNYTLADFVCGAKYETEITKSTSIGCNPNQMCTKLDLLIPGYICPYSYSCLSVHNPMFGYVGFDNIAQALLSVFTIITTEFFHNIMYWAMDSSDWTAAIFCLVVIIGGTFFIINVLTALITVEFERCRKEEKERLRMERLQRHGKVRGRSIIAKAAKAAMGFVNTQKKLAASKISEFEMRLLSNADADAVASVGGGGGGGGSDEAAPGSVRFIDKMRWFFMSNFVKRSWFLWCTTAVIVLNIILMAVDRYPQPQEQTDAFNTLNIIFTSLITVEMTIRFLATTPLLFILDVANCIGVLVVVVSWVDVGVDSFRLPAVNALRIVIALKLLEPWKRIYRWFIVMIKSFKASLVLLIIMSLDVFVMACLGMQLFGGKFCGLDEDGVGGWCENRPRINFDSFGGALVAVFQLLTADDWNLVMYNAMYVTTQYVAILFVGHHVFVIYVLVNLFIAILISATESMQEDENEENARKQVVENERKEAAERRKFVSRLNASRDDMSSKYSIRTKSRDDVSLVDLGTSRSTTPQMNNNSVSSPIRRSDASPQEAILIIPSESLDAEEANQQPKENFPFPNDEGGCWGQLRSGIRFILEENETCRKITDVVMVVTIIISSASLAFESPIAAPDETSTRTISIIDLVCTCIFILEFLLQCTAYGPLTHLRKTAWNKLDAFLVFCGVVDILLGQMNTKSTVRATKILYALRPLRLLRRSPGIQVVTTSLIAAIPGMLDVAFVTILFFVLFAIAGIQLFKGEFRRCSDEIYQTMSNCTDHGYSWDNPSYHFDHFGAALTTIFVISSFEGWSNVMYDGIDAVGPEQAPQLNYNPKAACFFLLVAIVAGFFLVNLFVSVLINTYEQRKKEMQKESLFLTSEQEAWLLGQKALINTVPVATFLNLAPSELKVLPTAEKIRVKTLQIVSHPNFDKMISATILLNAIATGLEHYPADDAWLLALLVVNIVFTAFFTLEAIAKLYGFGPKNYFSTMWNKFDFAVVLISIVGVIVEIAFSKKSFGTAFRTLRVVRLLRVVKGRPSLRELVRKFLLSLYALNNVAPLVVLFIFMSALLFMRVFGHVHRDGVVITNNANFEVFNRAFITLFRVSTGGAWPDLMAAYSSSEGCDPNIGNCGSVLWARVMFITFYLIAAYILLNVFVAVIMDTFGQEEIKDNMVLDEKDIDEFVAAWLKFDDDRSMAIPTFSILPLLYSLPSGHPFALVPKSEKRRRFAELCVLRKLNLTDHNNSLDFFQVISALNRAAFQVDTDSSDFKKLQSKFRRKFYFSLEKRKKVSEAIRGNRRVVHKDVAQRYAAKYLWEAWLVHKKSKELRKDYSSKSLNNMRQPCTTAVPVVSRTNTPDSLPSDSFLRKSPLLEEELLEQLPRDIQRPKAHKQEQLPSAPEPQWSRQFRMPNFDFNDLEMPQHQKQIEKRQERIMQEAFATPERSLVHTPMTPSLPAMYVPPLLVAPTGQTSNSKNTHQHQANLVTKLKINLDDDDYDGGEVLQAATLVPPSSLWNRGAQATKPPVSVDDVFASPAHRTQEQRNHYDEFDFFGGGNGIEEWKRAKPNVAEGDEDDLLSGWVAKQAAFEVEHDDML